MKESDRTNLTMCPRTEYFEINSTSVGSRLAIWVTLPPLYLFEDKSYPVLYLTDGNANGAITSSMGYALMTDMDHPSNHYIQVSVGYTGEEAKLNQITRCRDLVPPQEPFPPQIVGHVQARVDAGHQTRSQMNSFLKNVKNGKADRFLSFFEKELHHEILKRYRSTNDSTGLFGHSFGGLFSLYALVCDSPVFDFYCAASPGVNTAESIIYKKYFELAGKGGENRPARKLHMVANEGELTGSSENYRMLGREFFSFIDILRQNPLSNLTVTSAVIPGENHMSGMIDAYRSFVRACYR